MSLFFNSFLTLFIICELLKAINDVFFFFLCLSPLADIDGRKESLNLYLTQENSHRELGLYSL